jgi:site-specific DNA-methyltransferase (adenine-specific)/adenine-specific DNA-methyltransferase
VPDRELDIIRCGDVLDLVDGVPDGSVNLVIADPPYGIRKDFGDGHRWDSVDQWAAWSKKWISAVVPKLRRTGSIFVYGIHHYLCYLQVYMYEIGLRYRRQFIWHYENNWSTYTRAPAANYEPLLWFTVSDDYTFVTIREPYKSQERLKHKITKNGKTWQPHPEGRLAGDVWKFPTLAGRRFRDEKVDHPTQKPLSVSHRIVNHFSMPGDTILVPFAGSGTECVSALLNGRHFIGFEINEQYVRVALQRLNEARVNLTTKVQESALPC